MLGLISGPEANCHGLAMPVQLNFSHKPDREWSLACAEKVFPPENQGSGGFPVMWCLLQDTQAAGPDDLDALSAISSNKSSIRGSEYISVCIYWYVCLQLCAHFRINCLPKL